MRDKESRKGLPTRGLSIIQNTNISNPNGLAIAMLFENEVASQIAPYSIYSALPLLLTSTTIFDQGPRGFSSKGSALFR